MVGCNVTKMSKTMEENYKFEWKGSTKEAGMNVTMTEKVDTRILRRFVHEKDGNRWSKNNKLIKLEGNIGRSKSSFVSLSFLKLKMAHARSLKFN